MEEMTLEQFHAECLQRLDQFVKMWKGNMKDDPEVWPNSLAPGEWDEQLRAFEESVQP